MENLIKELIVGIGEDPQRQGLLRTPQRVAKSLKFLTKGYGQNVEEAMNNAFFEADTQEMVVVKDIDFYSLCEHHLLPFYGRCHVAYVPDKKIVGLSKLPRIVEIFSRRLQVQERLTKQIAEAVETHIQPLGVAVVLEARHLCMMMRGVEKQHSSAVTSSMLGVFRELPATRQEFLSFIDKSMGNI